MLVTVRDNYESPVIKFEPVFNLEEPKSKTDYNYSRVLLKAIAILLCKVIELLCTFSQCLVNIFEPLNQHNSSEVNQL